MPRQNFLSKESFVDVNEKQTMESLLSIPEFVPHINLIKENKIIESNRFSFELPEKKLLYHIDVSVLPLNDQYTRVSLHASYANGHTFYSDADIAVALHEFESVIHAAVKGELTYYQPKQPKTSSSKKLFYFLTAFVSSAGILFLKKKLS